LRNNNKGKRVFYIFIKTLLSYNPVSNFIWFTMHVCACVFYIQITRQIITFANFLSAKINHISSSKGKYQLKVSFIISIKQGYDIRWTCIR